MSDSYLHTAGNAIQHRIGLGQGLPSPSRLGRARRGGEGRAVHRPRAGVVEAQRGVGVRQRAVVDVVQDWVSVAIA